MLERLKQTSQERERLCGRGCSAMGEQSVKEYLARIGRKGGLKGGKARARKLSADRRSEIARKAAQARWARRRNEG